MCSVQVHFHRLKHRLRWLKNETRKKHLSAFQLCQIHRLYMKDGLQGSYS